MLITLSIIGAVFVIGVVIRLCRLQEFSFYFRFDNDNTNNKQLKK